MGETVSDEELVKFAKMLDWHSWVEESDEVRDMLSEVKSHIDGDELADAERVKLVVVGDSAVGKTSLLISYATNKFPDDYVPTVFENYTAQMELEGMPVLLHLWDTAGQEDYDRLRPLSYPGADVVLVCFCLVSSLTSEAVVEKWSPEVKHYIPDVPQVLVGTKVDLRNAQEADPHADAFDPISKEEGEKVAKEIGAVRYCELSAKTGEGLKAAFEECVRVVMERRGITPGKAAEPEKPKAKSPRSDKPSKSEAAEPKKKGEDKKKKGDDKKKEDDKKKKKKKDDKASKGGKKKGDKKNCKNQ